MIEFRLLEADEIECRVGTVKKGVGFSLLLYKDARCDMARLDELVGPMNWQRDHKELKGVIYCGVGVNRNYEDENKAPEWVWKWDAGAESRTEKEKGESSDSFKRACVNLGIGRELYTAPFIWLYGDVDNSIRYKVAEIGYDDARRINHLIIVEEKSGEEVYSFKNGKKSSKKSTPKKSESMDELTADFEASINGDEVSTNTALPARHRIILFCNEHGLDAAQIGEQYGLEKDMSEEVYAAKLSMLVRDYGKQ
ncbi:MAG: hypothetical protein IJI87_07545 [Mogibacterium sp.]|nr:hypothetical protein [Mogibacterium sp.]